MIMTTTSTLEGRKVTAYLGVVAGETAVNTNIFREFFSAVTRMVGEKSTETPAENKLTLAREGALRALEEKAALLGADAVIDVRVRFTQGSELMLIVSATGTAVKLGLE